MSQYLTHFYCGNKRGHCNYNEPIPYEKLMDRNFDNNLHQILNDCKGSGFQKGYCCDPYDKNMQKMVDDNFMEEMNRKFEANIFNKDEHGDFFPGQIPLVKPKTKDGEIAAMEICSCGGTPEEYQKCVTENCNDFKNPTRYEYCKLGPDLNKINCVLRGDNNNSDSQKRCKLEPLHQETQYTHSHHFKVNDLFPDCYLNLCNKDPKLQMLDQLVSSSTTDEHKYYKVLGDSLTSYGMLKNTEQLEQERTQLETSKASLFSLFQN